MPCAHVSPSLRIAAQAFGTALKTGFILAYYPNHCTWRRWSRETPATCLHRAQSRCVWLRPTPVLCSPTALSSHRAKIGGQQLHHGITVCVASSLKLCLTILSDRFYLLPTRRQRHFQSTINDSLQACRRACSGTHPFHRRAPFPDSWQWCIRQTQDPCRLARFRVHW